MYLVYLEHKRSVLILMNRFKIKIPRSNVGGMVCVCVSVCECVCVCITYMNFALTKRKLKRFIMTNYIYSKQVIKSLRILNTLSNKPLSLRLCSKSFVKTLLEKETLLVTSNFSFSHGIFFPFGELSTIFIKLKICCLHTLSVWKSL